jgi:hypothetical protein
MSAANLAEVRRRSQAASACVSRYKRYFGSITKADLLIPPLSVHVDLMQVLAPIAAYLVVIVALAILVGWEYQRSRRRLHLRDYSYFDCLNGDLMSMWSKTEALPQVRPRVQHELHSDCHRS